MEWIEVDYRITENSILDIPQEERDELSQYVLTKFAEAEAKYLKYWYGYGETVNRPTSH